MHLLFLIALVLLAVFGPGLWVRRVLETYSHPADRYSGTGAQLARHLLAGPSPGEQASAVRRAAAARSTSSIRRPACRSPGWRRVEADHRGAVWTGALTDFRGPRRVAYFRTGVEAAGGERPHRDAGGLQGERSG